MSLIPGKRKESLEHPLVSLRDEMNRLFDSFWRGDFLPERFSFSREFPSVEVTETDDEVIVRAEVPGLEAGDLDLSITGDVLTIKGEKKEEKEEKEKESHRREVHYGSFSRSVRLPGSVDADKVTAECKKGVLKITLGKVESEKAKKITVKGEPTKKAK
ncbi:MAG TPA: Hsp20/alpha crystallin family protein [Planctomycetota bacterium]|nr:Hsp20/alpha crystallin family protein [Planctomycetota bacterium]